MYSNFKKAAVELYFFLLAENLFFLQRKRAFWKKTVLQGCQKSSMIDTNVIYSVRSSFLTGIVLHLFSFELISLLLAKKSSIWKITLENKKEGNSVRALQSSWRSYQNHTLQEEAFLAANMCAILYSNKIRRLQ